MHVNRKTQNHQSWQDTAENCLQVPLPQWTIEPQMVRAAFQTRELDSGMVKDAFMTSKLSSRQGQNRNPEILASSSLFFLLCHIDIWASALFHCLITAKKWTLYLFFPSDPPHPLNYVSICLVFYLRLHLLRLSTCWRVGTSVLWNAFKHILLVM